MAAQQAFAPSVLPMTEVTRILSAIQQGDPHAAAQLLPLVYDELRRLATAKMAQEKPGQTLEATALVHEAYLRLVDTDQAQSWDNRRHFFAAAAEAMRRILVENARRKQSVRHGGGRQRLDLDDALSPPGPGLDLLALDEAVARLAEKQPVKAELVKLRFFAGLTMPEAAQALGLSLATAERYWTFARSWLYAELADRDDDPGAGKKSPGD
jgi:RNA polymerase sigma factor (TIGR02999 family)